jgi:Family of unknown function (DUF6092)
MVLFTSEKQEERLFDFFAFLVTSARGSLEEGVFSASLRLIDAARRVVDLQPSDAERDKFLTEMQSLIKEGMTKKYLASEEKYISFLDSILEKLGEEIRKRNNL